MNKWFKWAGLFVVGAALGWAGVQSGRRIAARRRANATVDELG